MPYIDKEKFRMHIILYQRNPLKVILTGKEKEKFIRMLDEFPTADVVEKERYDRLLENATIMDEALNEYQTADVHERNVGKWEKMWHSYFKQELPCCSVCGHFSAMRWKYCPNCGAKMDGKEETNDKD